MNSNNLMQKTLLGVAMLGLLSACGPTKADQCRQLSEVNQKGEAIAKRFEQESKSLESSFQAAGKNRDFNAFKVASSKSATTVNKAAQDFDGFIKEFGDVKLEDEKLSGLRTTYLQDATSLNTSLKDMAKILENLSKIEETPTGAQQLQKYAQELSSISGSVTTKGNALDATGNQIKSYCEGN